MIQPPRRAPALKSLERVLSKAGLCSRTEARSWIVEGRVSVDGHVTRSPERRIDPTRARVSVDDKPLIARRPIYLMLHKPAGYVTTSRDPEGRATVYDLLTDVTTFVAPVGRLDLETSGLLLLTNDTRFADRITSPASHVPKTYRVTTSRPLDPEELDALRRGPALRDGPTRPATVRSIDAASFEITITEGRNRQVRRMVEAVGARVTTLARVRIGTVTLGALPPGKWRRLSRAEVTLLSR